MKRAVVPFAVVLAVAVMPAAPGVTQVRSQSAKAFSDRMAALTDIQRRGALRGAIIDSGEKCVFVSKAAYQRTYKNLEMWVARCPTVPGKPVPTVDYGVFIGPDGTVQISSCAYLVSVKWPACRRLD